MTEEDFWKEYEESKRSLDEYDRLEASKKGQSLATLVTFPLIMLIFAGPIFVEDPPTAIGAAGLENVKRYCLAFVLTHIISALAIPTTVWLFVKAYQKETHKELLSRPIRIVIDIILLSIYILFFIRVSKLDLQSVKNGYNEYPLIQAVMLYTDVNKDLKELEVLSTEGEFELKKTGLHLDSPSSINPLGKGGDSYEYGIYDKNGDLLGQISTRDYNILSRSAFKYIPHNIETFQHSGLIKSIDGIEIFDNEYQIIELTYDQDAGVLRRKLIYEDEEMLPDMYLDIYEGNSMPTYQRVNGVPEIPFKPVRPGHYEISISWVEDNKYSKRISNVIEFDLIEYSDQ